MQNIGKTENKGIEVTLNTIWSQNKNFSWNTDWTYSLNREKIKALNEILKNYAAANNIVYVDYYSTMVDKRLGLNIEYSNDGVHPNKTGYQIMQPIIEKAIGQVLKKE